MATSSTLTPTAVTPTRREHRAFCRGSGHRWVAADWCFSSPTAVPGTDLLLWVTDTPNGPEIVVDGRADSLTLTQATTLTTVLTELQTAGAR